MEGHLVTYIPRGPMKNPGFDGQNAGDRPRVNGKDHVKRSSEPALLPRLILELKLRGRKQPRVCATAAIRISRGYLCLTDALTGDVEQIPLRSVTRLTIRPLNQARGIPFL